MRLDDSDIHYENSKNRNDEQPIGFILTIIFIILLYIYFK